MLLTRANIFAHKVKFIWNKWNSCSGQCNVLRNFDSIFFKSMIKHTVVCLKYF
jgi:hypothetical protein